MEVYHLCQPNTYVIAITAAHQIHEQWHRCWVDIGSIPPFLCPLFYLEQIFLLTCVFRNGISKLAELGISRF